jgi:hypothetical protein
MTTNDIKQRIIDAGYKAVDELIKVAEDKIITGMEGDLSADKLKNAAATKRLAIEDAFQILARIDQESEMITGDHKPSSKNEDKGGFAERRSK